MEINFKKYRIKLYKKNKIKKVIEMYDTYENIREALINKTILFESRKGLWFEVIYLKDYDKAQVELLDKGE